MSLARQLLIASLFAAPASLAAADPAAWSRTAMTAAPSYFPAGGTAMIVGVGEGAQPAAAALLQALQASSQLELASDASALGKVDALSDEQIVKRAFARPIQRVAIVRVFPAGGSVKAVVTVYAAQGQVTTAFTLVPGKDLADNPNPKAASDGVARDEMQSVTASVGDKGSDGDITYSRQQIVGVTAYGGLLQFDSVTFAQNGHPISDTPSLYDAIGMHSEASSYRSALDAHGKWAFRGGLMTTLGLTAFITFGTYALVAGASDDLSTNANGMPVQNDHTLAWGLTAVSAGVMILGIVEWAEHPAPTPLSADEAISLVDKHNAKKKQTTSLRFAPVATSTGGGLMLGGSW